MKVVKRTSRHVKRLGLCTLLTMSQSAVDMFLVTRKNFVGASKLPEVLEILAVNGVNVSRTKSLDCEGLKTSVKNEWYYL